PLRFGNRAERFARGGSVVRGWAYARSKPATWVAMFMLVLQASSSGGATTAPSAASAAPGGTGASAAPASSAAAGGPVKFTLWSNETYVNVPGFEAQSKSPGDWDKFL